MLVCIFVCFYGCVVFGVGAVVAGGLAVVLRRFWFGFVLLCLCCVFVVCFAVVFASVLVLCLDCLFGCCCDVDLT